jgi:hypothetical protein
VSFTPKDVTQMQRNFKHVLSNLKSVEMYSDFMLSLSCVPQYGGVAIWVLIY